MGLRPAMRNVSSELAESFAGGKPIVLAARFSGETGKASRRQAVDDLLTAADRLADFGVDIRGHLDEPEVLQEMLRAAPAKRSIGANGAEFTNRFVTIDLRVKCGVVVLLSIGSGSKLDGDFNQPFVAYAASLVRKVKPCLFFAKRIDRMTRSAWSLAPVMLFLAESEGFIGDADRGIRKTTGTDSLEIFFTAQIGEAEAKKLPGQTRNGMVRRTGTSLASPPCAYAVGHAAPPGLMTYRQRNRGQMGDRVITFEMPACVPPSDQVAFGLPEVYHCDSARIIVDQVANVRWVLARLGKPNWDHKRVAKGLAARRFSSEGIRRNHAPDTVLSAVLAADKPLRALRTILDHLDFYESGELTLRLGIDGFTPMTISGGFPPDGKPWAKPEDFARIRAWRARHYQPAPRRTVMSGLPILVNGIECVLTHRSGRTKEHPDYLRAVRFDKWKTTRQQHSSGHVVVLDPATIPEMFVEAIADAGDSALALVSHSEDSDLALNSEVQTEAAKLAVLEQERRDLLARLTERSPDGAPLITGALLVTLNERFNELDDQLLPEAKQRLTHAQERLNATRQARIQSARAVEVQHLLELIASLRDPYDTSNQDLFQRSVRNLRITVERHEHHRHVWRNYTLEFDVVIATQHGDVVVPAKRDFTYGNPYDVPQIATTVLDALCAGGTTYAEINPQGRHAVLNELAAALNVSSLHFKLPNVTDPRIAQLATMTLRWPDDLERISKQSGEPIEFLERVHHIHAGSTCARWVNKAQPRLKRWFTQALTGPIPTETISSTDMNYLLRDCSARAAWDLEDGTLRIAKCSGCQSRKRVPARIPEPAGLICIDCERDEQGQLWPIDTYGKYLLVDPVLCASSGDPRENEQLDSRYRR